MKGLDYSKQQVWRKDKLGKELEAQRKKALKEARKVLADNGTLHKCTLPPAAPALSKNQKRKRGGAGKKFNQRMRDKFEELTKAGIPV